MASIEQICEVLKAHSEGKTVQYKYKFPTPKGGVLESRWEDIDPTTCYITYLKSLELRIKPEPRELWVIFWNDGSYSICDSKQEAEEWAASSYVSRYEGVVSKLREVTDESE